MSPELLSLYLKIILVLSLKHALLEGQEYFASMMRVSLHVLPWQQLNTASSCKDIYFLEEFQTHAKFANQTLGMRTIIHGFVVWLNGGSPFFSWMQATHIVELVAIWSTRQCKSGQPDRTETLMNASTTFQRQLLLNEMDLAMRRQFLLLPSPSFCQARTCLVQILGVEKGIQGAPDECTNMFKRLLWWQKCRSEHDRLQALWVKSLVSFRTHVNWSKKVPVAKYSF